MGIDPGTARMGWGVVESTANGQSLRLVAYGVVETPHSLPLTRRLLMLHQGLTQLIKTHMPESAAVEELFFLRNVTTGIAVGQAQGVILLALAQAGLPVAEYTPREVKQSVTGYGNADKKQMQEMVRITLNLATRPQPDDAADALAIAICHAFMGRNPITSLART